MKTGLRIEAGALRCNERRIGDVGLIRYSKGFSVPLSDVLIIGIMPRLVIDDEGLFLVFIDRKGKKRFVNVVSQDKEGLQQIEAFFGLNSIREEWEVYSYEEHTQSVSKILYPSGLYGKLLF